MLVNTRIRSLPDSIGNLSSLLELDLHSTQISELPSSIGHLPSLKKLNLSGTPIKGLPPSLALGNLPIEDGPCEYGINVQDTMLPSYYLEGKEILSRYLWKDKKQGFSETKIIFLGDGNAGKTYTVNRFMARGAVETSENPYSKGQTHGVKPYDYPHKKEGADFPIHLWDFGGQELLHAMHRCFLTENTVYVLMVSTRDSEHTRRLRYWLHSIQPFARGAEITVIINVFDGEGTADIDIIGLKNEFKRDMKLNFVSISVKDASPADFIKHVIKPLIRKAEKAEKAAGLHPAIYMQVKEKIKTALMDSLDNSGRRKGWVSPDIFINACIASGITTPAEQAALLRYFTDLGVCFSSIGRNDVSIASDCLLIRPVWLTNALYAVIEECKPICGWVDRARIQACLAGKPGAGRSNRYVRVEPELRYDAEDCEYMLQVAQKYSLAYVDPDNKDAVFFPAMCSYADKRPNDLRQPKQAIYKVTYEVEYAYLSETVVHRLMLECLVAKFNRPNCWRGGFRFSQEVLNCSGIIDTVENDSVLRLELWSTSRDTAVIDMLKWFRKKLGALSDQRSAPMEYIVLENERYPLRRLFNAMQRGINRIPKEGDSDSEFTIFELLGAFPTNESSGNGLTQNITLNHYGNGPQAFNTGSGDIILSMNYPVQQETDLSWARFAANFKNTKTEFERLCTDLFRLEYFDQMTTFKFVPNNPRVEIHPIKAQRGVFAGKLVSFQAKHFEGEVGYTKIRDSMRKAIDRYHRNHTCETAIQDIILYCNKPISQGDDNGGPSGNNTFAETVKMLENAGIQLTVLSSNDLLDRISNYPVLVERYFYI